MTSIPKTLLFLVFLLAGSGAIFSQQDARNDPLWRRTLQKAQLDESWIPGLIIQRTEELDKKGRVNSTEELRIRMFPDSRGQIQSETRFFKNGKEHEYKETADPAEGGDHTLELDIFEGISQDGLKVERLSTGKVIKGINCPAFEFLYHTEDKKEFRGTVWVDPKSAYPLSLEYTEHPAPEGLQEMRQVIDFTINEQGAWNIERIYMEGKGRYFLTYVHFRVFMEFKNYWQHKSN